MSNAALNTVTVDLSPIRMEITTKKLTEFINMLLTTLRSDFIADEETKEIIERLPAVRFTTRTTRVQ